MFCCGDRAVNHHDVEELLNVLEGTDTVNVADRCYLMCFVIVGISNLKRLHL